MALPSAQTFCELSLDPSLFLGLLVIPFPKSTYAFLKTSAPLVPELISTILVKPQHEPRYLSGGLPVPPSCPALRNSL